MRLPALLRRPLIAWARWYTQRRAPDHRIGDDYLLRWYLTPWRRWGNIGVPAHIQVCLRDSARKLGCDVDDLAEDWIRWNAPTSAWLILGLRRFIRRLPNIYLHRFGRSDYDRALHDHPWWSMSIVLDGGYYEHVPVRSDVEHAPTTAIWRPAGAVTTRPATARHRIELPDRSGWVTTLFVTGVRRRHWGFYCPEGWRPYGDWERNGGCD